MNTKTCPSCKEVKVVEKDFFHLIKNGKKYYKSYCKKCDGKLSKIYREKNRENYIQYGRDSYKRNPEGHRERARKSYHKHSVERLEQKKQRILATRIAAIECYSQGENCCACCGEKIFDFLTLDHINNDGADHRREFGGRVSFSGDKFIKHLLDTKQLDRIQVLCMNCNWGKQRNNGICPHKLLSESSTTIPEGSTSQVKMVMEKRNTLKKKGDDIV